MSDYYASPSLGANETFKIYKFEVCASRWKNYIPCLDNAGAIAKLKSSTRGEFWERHCPRSGRMCCLIAAPLNYKLPIRWPRSRNEVSLPYPQTTIFISVHLVACSVLSICMSGLCLAPSLTPFCMQIRYSNVPYIQFLADKGGENWIKQWKDTSRFTGGDIQSNRSAHQFFDLIGAVSNSLARLSCPYSNE